VKQYPLDPEAATRGFLEQELEVTSSGHLNPEWVRRQREFYQMRPGRRTSYGVVTS
jgi:hypothetical protein